MIRETDIVAFVELLRGRLRVGAQQNGDRSLQRPLAGIIGEVEQELLDVAGWGLIAWVRLQRLRERIAAIDTGGAHGQS